MQGTGQFVRGVNRSQLHSKAIYLVLHGLVKLDNIMAIAGGIKFN